MTEKVYVIDTSVCLTDSRCIYKYGSDNIVIPMKVLEEIDKHKKRQDSVGANARDIIRELDDLREIGKLQYGVNLGKGFGNLKVSRFNCADMPEDFTPADADHVIITAAISEQKDNEDKKIIIVSRDINMRVMSDALGISSEGYIEDRAISNKSELYTGISTYEVTDEEINEIYSSGCIPAKELDIDDGDILENESVMLRSIYDEKKTVLTRYKRGILCKIRDINKSGVWGIKPRNKEQIFALDMLLDPDIPLVTMLGKSGSGKTLMSIASAIAQTISDPFTNDDPSYKKILMSRATVPMGRDIGYLPGDLSDKMHPWLMPIQDNLQYILGNDRVTLEDYVEKGKIEVTALTYMRGRSLPDTFILIDEVQNLSLHEIKTILTRAGENSKIVLIGDIEQIDNIYVDESSNGLVHVIEGFKNSDLSGHITLKKGERSRLATKASEIL